MTATTGLPPVHAPHVGGDPAAALQDIKGLIEHQIDHEPRTLQAAIGPSEIGTPCDHCLAAKLAAWPVNEQGRGWLASVGRAVHHMFENYVIDYENNRNANHTTGRRYLTEQPVMVGHIGGVEVWGSIDLIDLVVGMTSDYKLLGTASLRAAKRGPTPGYRVQQHLYGKGANDAGIRVDHVSIWSLPRNAMSLNDGVLWHEPYDPQVAADALARANHIHTQLQALASISAEARDAWITALPRAEGCWDCTRYPDGKGIPLPGRKPQAASDQLAGLLPPTAPVAGTNAA